jgi:hypothetical protein
MNEPKELKVRLTFIEDILGTASADQEIHAHYIASSAPDAPSKQEEIEAIGVEGVVEKAMTVFPRDKEGNPILWDYQVKGFFKNSCSALRKVTGSESSKVKAFKREIDGLIFIKERMIPFQNFDQIGNCQRPLRASTAQGERVALANSESIPAGAQVEFTIKMLCDSHLKAVIEWLDYGELNGIGQWHSSGKGRFKWEDISDK